MSRRIDLSGAEIRGGDLGDGGPPIFLPRQTAASPLLALDIGGSTKLYDSLHLLL
jgi:type II pantothenate kinase